MDSADIFGAREPWPFPGLHHYVDLCDHLRYRSFLGDFRVEQYLRNSLSNTLSFRMPQDDP